MLNPEKKERKGNCENQTKLAIAALDKARIALADDEGVGIQVFKNHLQPVIFRRNKDGKIVEVRNLISGRAKKFVEASIYDPSILYVGFLIKQGIKPAKSFDELAIARPDEADRAKSRVERELLAKKEKPATVDQDKLAEEVSETSDPDGTIAFPPAEEIAPDPGLNDVLMDPPDFESEPEVDPMGPIDSPDAGAPPADSDARRDRVTGFRILTFEEYANITDAVGFSHREIQAMLEDRKIDFLVESDVIAFRTSKLRDQFLHAGELQRKQGLLMTLVGMALDREEPLFKDMVADPLRRIPQIDAKEIQRVAEAIFSYEKTKGEGIDSLAKFMWGVSPSLANCRNPSDPDACDVERQKKYEALREKISDELVSQFDANADVRASLRAAVNDKPEAFAAMINSIDDPEKRMEVLEMIDPMHDHYKGDLDFVRVTRHRTHRHTYRLVLVRAKVVPGSHAAAPVKSEKFPALLQMLRDPRRIDLASGDDRGVQFTPIPDDDHLIWLDVSDAASGAKDTSPAPAEGSSNAPDVNARMLVSAPAMVGLLSLFDEPDLKKRREEITREWLDQHKNKH